MKYILIFIILFARALYADDCSSRYESLLQQYDGALKVGGFAVKICDKAGDSSDDCKQAQNLYSAYDLKPALKYLDQSCPNVYDSRFLSKVDQYSAINVEVKKRDMNNLIWRGDKKRMKAYMKNKVKSPKEIQ